MEYPIDTGGSGGPGIPTPGQLFNLAHDVPELAACLQLWQNGKVTYEQALMIAVRALAISNKRYLSDIRGYISGTIPNITIPINHKI